MNSEQWSSLIRVLLAIVLGPSSILVLKGILTQDQANQLIPICPHCHGRWRGGHRHFFHQSAFGLVGRRSRQQRQRSGRQGRR